MATQPSYFGSLIVRSGKSLLIHALFAAILAGLALWLTGAIEYASEQQRRIYETAPDPALALETVLGDARLNVIGWNVGALCVSWLASTVFVAVAERSLPRNEREGGSRTPAWFGLMVFVVLSTAIAWWRQVDLTGVGAVLVSGSYLALNVAGYVLVVFAFWLASAMTVKMTMRPSVPLSPLVPSFWN